MGLMLSSLDTGTEELGKLEELIINI